MVTAGLNSHTLGKTKKTARERQSLVRITVTTYLKLIAYIFLFSTAKLIAKMLETSVSLSLYNHLIRMATELG